MLLGVLGRCCFARERAALCVFWRRVKSAVGLKDQRRYCVDVRYMSSSVRYCVVAMVGGVVVVVIVAVSLVSFCLACPLGFVLLFWVLGSSQCV